MPENTDQSSTPKQPTNHPSTTGSHYRNVDYGPRSRPTEGKFEALHPHQSDHDLVTTYSNETKLGEKHLTPHPDTSRDFSIQAEQIRSTWGKEATFGAEMDVDDNELITRLDRSVGILLGLACGDVLGRPVEFLSPEQISEQYGLVDEFLADGSHNQPAGTITDDTQLALYLTVNLLENGQFDIDSYAKTLIEWYESDPFDVGVTTRVSIECLQMGLTPQNAGQRTIDELGPENAAGNGSIMRCAPLAIAYPDMPQKLQQESRNSSILTHADPRCTHGCSALNLVLAALLQGSKEPLKDALELLDQDAPTELTDRLQRVLEQDDQDDLKNTGYILDTLETALSIGLSADSPEEGIVEAVNRGGDADTIGAITGAILGARFGAGRFLAADHKPDTTLPDRWLTNLSLDVDFIQNSTAPALLEIGQLSDRGVDPEPDRASDLLKSLE